MRVVVVIPAYNEAHTVGEVVRNVRAHVPDVIVVDDGSDDTTGDRARHAGARVITHCVNRGLGAALGTGITAALGHHSDIIVTLDADGQHDPADIAAVIAPIQAGFADLVIGTRALGHRVLRIGQRTPGVEEELATGKHPVSGAVHEEPRAEKHRVFTRTPDVGERAAPLPRRLANTIANLLTHLLFGVRCSDTQSGFRAFSRQAASLIDIRTNRMEVSSEILAEAARLGLRIAEVPIRTIYTKYSLSKGQSLVMGLRTAWSLFLRKLF